MNWKYPKYWNVRVDAAKLTEASIAEMKADSLACDEANAQIAQEWSRKFADFFKTAKELYGDSSAIVKYIKNKGAMGYTPIFADKIPDYERKMKEARELLAREEQAKQIEAAKADYTQRAIIWLQARGLVLGTDFTIADAAEKADAIAYEEEVKRRQDDGGPYDFDGKNCDDCTGWDGSDRRCNCGNRRVSWERCDWHTFDRPAIRGVAY